MAVAAIISVRARVSSSWDTQPRPFPIPNPKNQPSSKNKNPKSVRPLPQTIKSTPSTTLLTTLKNSTASELLTRNNPDHTQGKSGELYLGYERWLPVPPKVKKPRSVYNAASLAYIGDCIYELYARRHFLFPPLSIEEYNDRV